MEKYEIKGKHELGFWIYLMTDLLMFAALFATYAVLHNNTFGGPTSEEIFNLPYVFIETLVLLSSTFTMGIAVVGSRALAYEQQRKRFIMIWLFVTFLLGAIFVGMELHEFGNLIAEGHTWQTSAFLSSFFALVGTHGFHIMIGLLWILVMIGVISKKGLTEHNLRNLTLLSLFWHFLDLVWIFIFTVVYLMGVT